jgi:FMN phosphatase YigB (HAD superfamily)
MLKSLFPQVTWDQIEAVGFDLDGTIYDELDFILQVYLPIAILLANLSNQDQQEVYRWMVNRWLEKGSSYNRIFEEVLSSKGVDEGKKTIERCLHIFKHFRPEISLTNRVKILLDNFKSNYPLFLITDGNDLLQRAKFKALGLGKWFEINNIAISGDYGRKYQKPSAFMASQIEVLRDIKPSRVIYFGDREVDALFARNAGFGFIPVKVMQVGVIS